MAFLQIARYFKFIILCTQLHDQLSVDCQNKYFIISFLSPNNSSVSGDRDIVSTREGKALATSLEVSYAECSSLTNDGVQQALNKATELAINFINQEKSVTSKALGFFKRRSKNSCSVKDKEPLPPELPPAGNRLNKNIPFDLPYRVRRK